jgi:hypothetical protein
LPPATCRSRPARRSAEPPLLQMEPETAARSLCAADPG